MSFQCKGKSPFPYIDALMPLQQKTFENIVTKGEIAHHEQFSILPRCFQHYLIVKH